VRKRKKIDHVLVEQAAKECLETSLTVQEAAEKYGVPKECVGYVSRHMKKKQKEEKNNEEKNCRI